MWTNIDNKLLFVFSLKSAEEKNEPAVNEQKSGRFAYIKKDLLLTKNTALATIHNVSKSLPSCYLSFLLEAHAIMPYMQVVL